MCLSALSYSNIALIYCIFIHFYCFNFSRIKIERLQFIARTWDHESSIPVNSRTISLMHRVEVNSSGCWYSSRYLKSDSYSRNLAANTIAVTEMGTAGALPPNQGFLAKWAQLVFMIEMKSIVLLRLALTNWSTTHSSTLDHDIVLQNYL